MTGRPYVVLSCAMSLDGCLDGTGEDRLVLSGQADLDRVDAERAAADAILVGAGTIRRDDPRLLVRSASRQAERRASGRPPQPAGVTVTASGDLDPAARFFTRDPGEGSAGKAGAGEGGAAASAGAGAAGDGGTGRGGTGRTGRGGAAARRIVYAATPVLPKLSDQLGGLAEVVDGGDPPRLTGILADLAGRGVRRLMVEGGASLGTQFLAGGLVDELQLVIAPFFVGDPAAPRFAGPGHYPANPDHPLHLAEARPVGEVVLLRYLAAAAAAPPDTGEAPRPRERTRRLADPEPGSGPAATAADREWLRQAIDLSRCCPPSASAFCVGAVIVAADGDIIATGFSRQHDPHDHAEEGALAAVDPGDPRLPGATLYSSLEPCRFRASRPRPCAELIIAAGLRRVVIAWREPPVFAQGGGAELLRSSGVTVVEIPELADEARAVNASVLGG